MLERAGVPSSTRVRVRGRDEAQAAAGQLGYPVVVKALGMLHKSDAGGVASASPTPRSCERAVADMERAAGARGALASSGWRRCTRASS